MNWLPLITVLVQVTLVAAVGLLTASLLRSAAHRHSVLLAALLFILAGPIIYAAAAWAGITINLSAVFPARRASVEAGPLRTPVTPYGQQDPWRGPFATSTELPQAALESAPVMEKPREPAQVGFVTLRLEILVAALCLVGTFVYLAGVVRSHWTLQAVLRSVRPLDAASHADLVAEAASRLETSVFPRIGATGKVPGPVVAGLFHPWVLIPSRYLATLSREELLQVLTHEGAHALRRDPLFLLLQRVTGALFWWHPLVYFVNQQLSRAREDVCDNFVLGQIEPTVYGATLLRIATLSPAMAMLPAASGMLDARCALEGRIRGLLDSRRMIVTRVRFGTAAAVLGGFALCSVLVAGARLGAQSPVDPSASAGSITAKEVEVKRAKARETDAKKYQRPTVEDQQATAMIPAEAWGNPVDGLRVAIVMQAPPVDEHDELRYEIVAENVSDQDIRFAASVGNRWLAFAKIELVDANGKQLEAQQGVIEKWQPWLIRFWLKPRERVLISPCSTKLARVDRKGNPIAEPARHYVGPFFKVSPGQYAVSAAVELGPSVYSGDSVSRTRTVISPAKGEWSGKLKTGTTLVRLSEGQPLEDQGNARGDEKRNAVTDRREIDTSQEERELDEVRRKIDLYEFSYRQQAVAGAALSRIGNVQDVANSPDKKLVAVASGNQIYFLDATTGKVLRKFAAHEKGVSSVAFAPGGKMLASSGGDRTVRFWDVSTGKQVKIINIKVAGKNILFSDDGREFGLVTNDGVRYYAVTSGMLLRFAPGAKWPTRTK